MAEKDSSSVLQRKLAASDADRGKGRSALRALRLALARAAKDLYDLPLAVIGAKQARIEQAAAEGFLADDRLLVLLDGAHGQAGAVSLDSACVTALTQQQTMGRVTGAMANSREFTSTDAALAEPLIEMLLSRAAALSDSVDDQRCLEGFRFGAIIEDVRSLMLVLDTKRYRVFDLTIDIAEGAMQGAICLVLPDLPPGTDKDGGPMQTGPRLDQGFGVIRADLTASIGRLRVPLAELSAMQPGDVLPLTRERLEETQLITICGKPVASGRLGQVNGLRAVRLNQPGGLAGQGVSEDAGFAASATDEGGAVPLSLDTPGNVVADGETVDMPVTGDVALPDLPVLPDLPDLPGLPAMAVETTEEDLIAKMTPEQAAIEITQLAGLDTEGGDG
ncbi:MAG: FliM/FliN family flagellar motor C-terminal domain-containing protein [Rhodobacteraceae bacterium]|nr:FliM/FliN family flagellar motor C-terminal domain-containing protein [Paracoccaceae bacterium]